MGASQSSEGGVPIQGEVTPQQPVGESGVRITGTAVQSLEDRVKEAYEQGRMEGVQSFQSSLEIVAVQVYDNVQQQLAHIQQESLNKSESVVSNLAIISFLLAYFFLFLPFQSKQVFGKLQAPTRKGESECAVDKKKLSDCFSQNKTNPLACDDLVNAYSVCATNLI
jgi:hypothetical protein